MGSVRAFLPVLGSAQLKLSGGCILWVKMMRQRVVGTLAEMLMIPGKSGAVVQQTGISR